MAHLFCNAVKSTFLVFLDIIYTEGLNDTNQNWIYMGAYISLHNKPVWTQQQKHIQKKILNNN